jgi:hypothetical protein
VHDCWLGWIWQPEDPDGQSFREIVVRPAVVGKQLHHNIISRRPFWQLPHLEPSFLHPPSFLPRSWRGSLTFSAIFPCLCFHLCDRRADNCSVRFFINRASNVQDMMPWTSYAVACRCISARAVIFLLFQCLPCASCRGNESWSERAH